MGFKINGEIALDGSMFRHGLNEASAESAKFFKEFALGAVGIYGVEQAFHKTLETAEQLADASKNLSITTDELQILKQAAKENGLEFENMTVALQRFNAVRENILTGGKGSAAQLAALSRLGVSKADIESDQTGASLLMNQISGAARKSNAADIANDLKQVFGRAGTQLFGTLQTNFKDFGEEMRKAGEIMDTDTIAKLKVLGDSFQAVSTIIITALAPALAAFAEWVGRFVLLGAGKVSGMGAEAGAANALRPSIMATQSADINDPANIAHADAIRRAGNENAGVNVNNEAAKAFEDAERPFQKSSEELTKKIAELRFGLEHPTHQKTADELNLDSSASKKSRRPYENKTDSLIEVGNFLGSGKNAINSIAQQQLEVARSSLDEQKNTTKAVETLNETMQSNFRNDTGGDGVDYGG
jgi:hypothetical protein